MFVLFLMGLSLPSALLLEVENPLVIDHDGGADDAMAIFLALLFERNFNGPTIIGITTSHGNVDEEQVFKNTQRFLCVADRRDIPIYRGSSYSLISTHVSDYFFGKDGLGDAEDVEFEPVEAQPEHAVNALIELSKQYEGKLTVVVLGALTNIALAVRIDPIFISRLKIIYLAAGHIYGDVFKQPQYNVLMDVEAYYVVAENSIPDKVVMVPHSPFKIDPNSNGTSLPGATGYRVKLLNLLRNIISGALGSDQRLQLYQVDGTRSPSPIIERGRRRHRQHTKWRKEVLGKLNNTLMERMNEFEKIASNFLDTCVMAMVLNESFIQEYKCSINSVHLCGAERGLNTNKFTSCDNANVKLALPSPVDQFKDFLYSIFMTA